MMGIPMPRTVANVEYTTFSPEGSDVAMNTLRIDLDNGESVYVPNGNWSAQNPALCVMAWLGARPSALEDAEGALLPVVITEEMEYAVPDLVINMGRRQLKQAEWFHEDAGSTQPALPEPVTSSDE